MISSLNQCIKNMCTYSSVPHVITNNRFPTIINIHFIIWIFTKLFNECLLIAQIIIKPNTHDRSPIYYTWCFRLKILHSFGVAWILISIRHCNQLRIIVMSLTSYTYTVGPLLLNIPNILKSLIIYRWYRYRWILWSMLNKKQN